MSVKPRVLLVHADAWVRVTLSSVLEAEGFDVVSVSNGASAVRSIGQRGPDLVLVGPQLAEISRADLRDLLATDVRTRGIRVLDLEPSSEMVARCGRTNAVRVLQVTASEEEQACRGSEVAKTPQIASAVRS